jgi:DNA-binding LacI/PurR family transcriptional regulator
VAVSMTDVARHAGVSQRTVSNVVNNAAHVAPATRAKVEASLDALGYRPNVAARQLRTGRTGTVTIAIPGLGERYFADLADAVIRHATAAGIRVLLETTGGSREAELALIDGRAGVLTDGLIMSAVGIRPGDERPPEPGHPIVLVGDRETRGWLDHVGIPNRRATRAAVQHLFDLGRTRVALLGRVAGQAESSGRLRHRGWLEAFERAGRPAPGPELHIDSDWTRQAGQDAAEALLAAGAELPDGVFAMNDSVALGFLRGLARAGVRVPEDVAVIGFDDIEESRWANPSLSSVAPSLDAIAVRALELLAEQQAAGPDLERQPHQQHVDFTLQLRESTVGRTPQG